MNMEGDKYNMVPMPDLTFGLADPRKAAEMTGLEKMQAIVRQDFPAPPIVEVTQQWIHEVGEGHVTFLGNPDPRYLNPMRLIHGGWTMTLLDSALGCAIQTVLKRGETFATLGTEVKFLRPILPSTGQVRCRAEIESRGTHTATASGRVEDTKGRMLATGTTTCFIRNLL
ncbi:PaaI family thioesterase [Ruegeria sp. MALMAid1280]|uniref:PaaI family thioesterase n=1 Tax=Ruegeria sp. MALMAid1280 TaxID=3411634 RepID=UPI003B9E3600